MKSWESSERLPRKGECMGAAKQGLQWAPLTKWWAGKLLTASLFQFAHEWNVGFKYCSQHS